VTNPVVPAQQLSATDLTNAMVRHIEDFLRIVTAASPHCADPVVRRLSGAGGDGYKIRLSHSTPNKIEVNARCSKPHALGRLVDYLSQKHNASIQPVSRYHLRVIIILDGTAVSELNA